jgi:hypothetical protein
VTGIWHLKSCEVSYQMSRVVFVPPKGHGIANLFIMLSDFFYNHPDGLVHESIKNFEIGRWLTFHFELTDRTDLPTYDAKIFINQFTVQHVHPLIRKLVSPSLELIELLEKHKHLTDNAKLGVHVRRGASAPDSRNIVSFDTETFASTDAVEQMVRMVENVDGPVFLASDSPLTKKYFPENVRTLDTGIAVVHEDVKCNPSDRVSIFLDFFLLSQCPQIIVTGGNYPGHPGLSTFGYMAAIYGEKRFIVVKNPT